MDIGTSNKFQEFQDQEKNAKFWVGKKNFKKSKGKFGTGGKKFSRPLFQKK